jgi:hypothetical protein
MIGYTEDAPTFECRVELSLINARSSPNTIVNFCCGDYTQCPTWRLEKERQWANREALVEGGPR